MKQLKWQMLWIKQLDSEQVEVKPLEECLAQTNVADKRKLPMMCALDRTSRGSFDEAAKTHFLIVDVDDGCSKALYREALEKFAYVMYDSFSSIIEKPRFRVVIPLSEVVPMQHVTYKKKALASVFKHCDPCTFDFGRWFFCPSVRCGQGKQSAKVEVHEGAELDFYELVGWSPLDDIMVKSFRGPARKLNEKMMSMHDDDRVDYYLSTPFPMMTGNGDSASSLYTAICVCLANGDDDTLEEVLDKARSEHWSETELNRSLKNARRYLGV